MHTKVLLLAEMGDYRPRFFFGVGTLHTEVLLLAEMGDLPVKLLARIKCVLFSTEYDGWLLLRIATTVVRLGRGTWIGKMGMC